MPMGSILWLGDGVKLASIVGARPQFVKEAAVARALQRRDATRSDPVEEVLIHTGQHYDFEMSAVFFQDLSLPEPDHHLGVGSGRHGAQTGAMLAALESVLEEEAPDAVLVYGDTNSTLAGALAAAKLHVPVGHVEAGLRSFNRLMAEEVNRVLTDHVSNWLFTPSGVATKNLSEEGITQGVHQVGDVMFDVLRWQRSTLPDVEATKPYVLATIHRAENTDDPRRLAAIAGALEDVAAHTNVIFPVHPRTAKALDAAGVGFERVHTSAPVGYGEMVALESGATTVVTDSGGVQKEAYWLGVPCITVRDETEWTETVDEGWNKVVSPVRSDVAEAVVEAGAPHSEREAYGTGSAADEIVAILSAGVGR